MRTWRGASSDGRTECNSVLIILGGFGLQAYQSYLEAAGLAQAIQQETHGAASPPVANTKGDVTITVTQPPAPSSEKSQ